MADYYSRGVIETYVALTPLLYKTLETQGAGFELIGDSHETVLDALVHGRPPMHEYYVYFSEGWSDGQGAEEYLAWTDTEGLSPEDLAEFTRLLDLESQDLLLEILKVNPELSEIEAQFSHSCSKMRKDGFGGYGLIVNRKGFLCINTGGYKIDKDGTIQTTSAFTFWEPEHVNA